MAPSFSSTRILATRSAAAAAMLMATYSLAPTASQAREPIAPACRQAGNELAQLKCSIALSKKATAEHKAQARKADAEITASDRNIASANKRSAAADKEVAEAQKVSEAATKRGACMDALTKEIVEAKKTGPLSPDQKALFTTRYETCNAIRAQL